MQKWIQGLLNLDHLSDQVNNDKENQRDKEGNFFAFLDGTECHVFYNP